MIKIGIIGAGGIAQAHVQSLAQLSKVRIVAVADIQQEKAQATAAQCGARAVTDYKEVFGLVDAVYICTPPTLHREHIVAAAEAGKAIFCEKPLATSMEDGEAIVRSVREHGIKMMVGFNHRFRPSFQKMKEICTSGALGEMLSYWTVRMARDQPGGDNWRITPGLLCGITIESVAHDIDLLRWMWGEVSTVQGKVSNSLPSLADYDDNVSAIMTMKNGGVATFHVSWSSHVSFNTRGAIGTKGSVCVEGPGMWTLSAVRSRTAGSEREEVSVVPADRAEDMGYLTENRHFVECLKRGVAFSVTELDGLAALKISLAIHRSSREHCVVWPEPTGGVL